MVSQLITLELKVAYPLKRTLSVAYEHNQAYVYFILKLLRISETVYLF